MNARTFSRDRIIYLISSAIGTGLVFSPFPTPILMWGSWIGVVVFALLVLFGQWVLMEGSNRTVVYVAAVASRELSKKHGAFGQILDHVPPTAFAAAWIWTSHLALGATIGMAWLAATVQCRSVMYVWRQLDEDDRQEMLKVMED